jgi:hypothetical protein
MTGIRILIGVIIAAIVGVALVPLLVLLDLVGGGDGWGLCPDGVASCATSYFDGPELAASLLVIMFMLLTLLRLALHIQRLMDGRRSRLDSRSMGRRDGFGRG